MKINKKNIFFILDRGTQHSSFDVQNLLSQIGVKTSMFRIGNSLDNREIEYFFGCLKGEYFNKINTVCMKIREIRWYIEWYINWYNNVRIQRVLK